jgi:hypothetical protein
MEIRIAAAILTTTLLSACAPDLSIRLTEQCDYDRITQTECMERNTRSDEAYRSDIERILNER